MDHLKHDEIGCWSEIKLDIIREYAQAYSKILASKKNSYLQHEYIDAFAGSGKHLSKRLGEFVAGSPLNALIVEPPFKAYHFIDLNSAKVGALQKIADERKNVSVHHGDCNDILLNIIFPKLKWSDYKRALCILDPYGLHLNWDVLKKAGEIKTIDLFYNFSIMDANMNILRKDPHEVDERQMKRMNAVWGDDSWKKIAYHTNNFFQFEEKEDNDKVASAFRERLIKIAGFKYVPKPVPMKNSKGSTVYYLYFASHKPVAEHIVKQIFDKYI